MICGERQAFAWRRSGVRSFCSCAREANRVTAKKKMLTHEHIGWQWWRQIQLFVEFKTHTSKRWQTRNELRHDIPNQNNYKLKSMASIVVVINYGIITFFFSISMSASKKKWHAIEIIHRAYFIQKKKHKIARPVLSAFRKRKWVAKTKLLNKKPFTKGPQRTALGAEISVLTKNHFVLTIGPYLIWAGLPSISDKFGFSK